MNPVIKIMLRVLAVTFLVVVIAPCALAQKDISDDEPEGCERTVGLEREQCEGEADALTQALMLEDAAGRPLQSGELQLSLAQIREDLSYLQAAASYLLQSASQRGELDFEALAKSASEIRRRANRLKESLALPSPEKSAKARGEKALFVAWQLRTALSALSALLFEVVPNPVLRGRLLDATMAARAMSELDKIIELSERIKSSSEALGQDRQ
jgi:hypothetical protein